MGLCLLLRLLRQPPPSPLLHLTTPFASSGYRLFSTATAQAPPFNPPFAAVDYLIRSCGLPSEVAIRASKKIQHLKSIDKPDAVLWFLRRAGISESNIQTAVSRKPRILCSSVEKSLTPNVAKLQDIGLSIEDISGIISRSPELFCFNIVPKIDFWMEALGSVKFVSVILKAGASVLRNNLEKVVRPNLSFLQEKFGLSPCQIVRLVTCAPRLMSCNPETLKIRAKKAEDLGAACSQGTLTYALFIANVNEHIIDARLNYLTSVGFSREDVNCMICRAPFVLRIAEELIGRKVQFLINEARCDRLHIVQNPALLTYSLEKRLIPRNLIWKLLKSKELPAANIQFVSFLVSSENNFVKKYVVPFEHAIPGLHQSYLDACAGKTVATECFKNNSS
jgi:mTERF domain-containing protein, mitochondrial